MSEKITPSQIQPNMRFGRLVTINKTQYKRHPSGGRSVFWLCKCDCGNTIEMSGRSLCANRFSSCGCYSKERLSAIRKKHGEKHTKLYGVWCGMNRRCHCITDPAYKWYGAKGINVCNEWNTYTVFRDWAYANNYQPGLWLDRIDPHGNYEPSNCRWTTPLQQQNNRGNNVLITYGEKTLTMAEWARNLGVNYDTFRCRVLQDGGETTISRFLGGSANG